MTTTTTIIKTTADIMLHHFRVVVVAHTVVTSHKTTTTCHITHGCCCALFGFAATMERRQLSSCRPLANDRSNNKCPFKFAILLRKNNILILNNVNWLVVVVSIFIEDEHTCIVIPTRCKNSPIIK